MAKLTDTQLVVLSKAAAREDGLAVEMVRHGHDHEVDLGISAQVLD